MGPCLLLLGLLCVVGPPFGSLGVVLGRRLPVKVGGLGLDKHSAGPVWVLVCFCWAFRAWWGLLLGRWVWFWVAVCLSRFGGLALTGTRRAGVGLGLALLCKNQTTAAHSQLVKEAL